MHDWSSIATNVSVQGDFVINNGVIEKINNGSATIVTTSIKSQKNSGLMDSRTHETLKAKTSPNITYTQVRVVSVQPANGEAVVTLSGNLNIGGTAKPTEFVVRMKMLANGDVEVKGTKKILMSTYGIKPPSFMLGALKVGDEVSLDIYVLLHKN
jgi:polyisoprenoid-binding protein YceI